MRVFKENVQTCPYSVPEGCVRHPFSQYSGLNFPALWWTLIWHGFGSVKIDTGSKISSLWPFQDSYRFRKFHSPINLEYYSSPLKDGQTFRESCAWPVNFGLYVLCSTSSVSTSMRSRRAR